MVKQDIVLFRKGLRFMFLSCLLKLYLYL